MTNRHESQESGHGIPGHWGPAHQARGARRTQSLSLAGLLPGLDICLRLSLLPVQGEAQPEAQAGSIIDPAGAGVTVG